MSLPDFQCKTVTLLGAGVSNMPLAGYLAARGAILTVRDRKSETDLGEAAEKLKKNYPQIKIIIITSQPEYSYIAHARKIGVESFWYKEPTAEALLKVMDRTMAGESIYPDSAPITRLGAALSDDFTERELEVLRELVSGKTDAAIAETLCLSVARVKQHIQRIREKTQFANRTELAVRARESGLVIGDYKHL